MTLAFRRGVILSAHSLLCTSNIHIAKASFFQHYATGR